MLKNFFKTLFGKKSSDENTRKIEDSCNYWADNDEVDYSPSFTAQDVLSSAKTVSVNNTTSKETEKDKKSTFHSSCGGGGCGIGSCGGGCIGGCGGGCF